ncbi:pre-16S rRNA-processing nuclease YqgF [Selenomonas artemidis]|uniref:pre-16S rRNA-processing nuclease YqgF n=1 Tax=Selenomonas artemidis TaxID=671224 RepID=UPI001CABDB91|nr:pre-16S rRNA-processing nuclease YqgF [Selenomonas artemidis]MBF1681532.1 pre-16S rRNA-processing nuclease YqgF [Selenomonas artemidis]
MSTVLAIDPGRDKCGIAVLSPQGDVLLHEIVPTGALETRVSELAAEYAPRIIMGDGTTSAAAKARIEAQVGAVTLVDEYRTTEEGRRLYWAENPPSGWRRLMPRGLLTPTVPVDDFAAVALARRFLAGTARRD